MWDWIEAIGEVKRSNKPAVLVSVIRYKGSSPRKTDAKMLVFADGTFSGTIGGGSLEKQALEDALKCLEEGQSRIEEYSLVKQKPSPCCGGFMEVFMEVINDNPKLYLFGAGHVGQAVCGVMKGTPFKVHLIDKRSEWINSPQIPNETIRHQQDWLDFIQDALWEPTKTYVAIMTYNGDMDQEILSEALKHSTRYIGVIGSANKWQVVKKNLGLTQKELSRIKCPLGIDNGGKSPQEIAIGLAAEILSIYHGKQTF